MTRLDETMRHYCEQQASRAGAVSLLARQFLPGTRAERAVVTTAYVEAIEAIASEVSDPGVAATKFQWWRQALAGANEAGARHPLIGALEAHGQLSAERLPLLQAHLGAAGALIDPEPVANADALYDRLAAPGAIRSLVVSGADVGSDLRDALAGHGAVSIALARLAQDMPAGRGDAWWVPMDWRARHAGDADQGTGPQALVAEAAALLATWQERADDALTQAAARHTANGPLFDFLALESGLRLRWLRRIAARPGAFFQGARSAMRRRDAWFAWRRARRLARQHERDDR